MSKKDKPPELPPVAIAPGLSQQLLDAVLGAEAHTQAEQARAKVDRALAHLFAICQERAGLLGQRARLDARLDRLQQDCPHWLTTQVTLDETVITVCATCEKKLSVRADP